MPHNQMTFDIFKKESLDSTLVTGFSEQLSILGAIITGEVKIQPGSIFLTVLHIWPGWFFFFFTPLSGIYKSLWHLSRDPKPGVWGWQNSEEESWVPKGVCSYPEDPVAPWPSRGTSTLLSPHLTAWLHLWDFESTWQRNLKPVFIHEFDIACLYVESCGRTNLRSCKFWIVQDLQEFLHHINWGCLVSPLWLQKETHLRCYVVRFYAPRAVS